MRYYDYTKDELDGVLRGLSRSMLELLDRITRRRGRDKLLTSSMTGRVFLLRGYMASAKVTAQALCSRGLIDWTYRSPGYMRAYLTSKGKAVLNRWKVAQR